VGRSAGVDVGAQRCIRVGDFADHPDCWLCREPEPCLELGVEALLCLVLAVDPLGVHRSRQPRRRLITRAQCGLKGRRLLPGRQHPHLHHLLHAPHGIGPHRQLSAKTPTCWHRSIPSRHGAAARTPSRPASGPRHLVFVTNTAVQSSLTRCSPSASTSSARCAPASARRCASSPAKPTTCTCSCTTHPASPYRCWSSGATAYRLAGCVSSTLCTLENTCEASTSGQRPTSPPPAAAHPCPSSSNTSNSRTAPTNAVRYAGPLDGIGFLPAVNSPAEDILVKIRANRWRRPPCPGVSTAAV
jgi:hypothetical protein